jgi:hypothetical protein
MSHRHQDESTQHTTHGPGQTGTGSRTIFKTPRNTHVRITGTTGITQMRAPAHRHDSVLTVRQNDLMCASKVIIAKELSAPGGQPGVAGTCTVAMSFSASGRNLFMSRGLLG